MELNPGSSGLCEPLVRQLARESVDAQENITFRAFADRDVTDSRQGRALERFRIFLQASGLHRADRRRVAEAVVANHDWTYAIVTEAAAVGHQGFADHWRAVAGPTARARRWTHRHRRDLLAAAR